jgi:Uma2 family endonuclease
MSFALAQIDPPLRLRRATPMSDGEFMRFCAANEPLRFEREPNGEILVMTPAGNRTGRINAYIVQVLGNWSDVDGRGYYFDSSTGFTLPDGSVRSPDASWVQAWRWDALSEEDKDRYSPLCPDFVIELRSPGDKLSGLHAKMDQWIANGIQVGWLIDPKDYSVTIYRAGGQPEHIIHPVSVRGTGPVAGFELAMSRIWV